MPVSFLGWVKQSYTHFRTDDSPLLKRLIRPIYFIYVAIFLTLTHIYPYGTNIYDKEWDMIIILDACRVDALKEVAPEYDFITDINSITSVGSTSFEWMPRTFTNNNLQKIKNTAYVSGNPYTERVFREKEHPPVRDFIPFGPKSYDTVDPSDFKYLKELWKATYEGSFNRLPPRFTTEYAIWTARNIDFDYLIVHYMYPHNPYPLADNGLRKPFPKLRKGDISRDTVWELYLDNLRYVLDDVEILLDNIDAENVVITADHGEAFGEYGFYKHEIACPLPSVRTVPWVTTSGEDLREVEPEIPNQIKNTSDVSASERLEALGYI